MHVADAAVAVPIVCVVHVVRLLVHFLQRCLVLFALLSQSSAFAGVFRADAGGSGELRSRHSVLGRVDHGFSDPVGDVLGVRVSWFVLHQHICDVPVDKGVAFGSAVLISSKLAIEVPIVCRATLYYLLVIVLVQFLLALVRDR